MKRTSISVDESGRVEVVIGGAQASAPMELLGALIKVLEAARLVVDAESSVPAAGVARSVVPAPAPAAPARAPKAAPRVVAQPRKAAAVAPPVVAAPKKAKPYQRKSRKPVAPALIAWLEAHPGWHHEDALLRVVAENKMTDADPKRALKIALGKARGRTFDADGNGHWKLVTDDAGPAPRVTKRAAKRAGGKAAKATTSKAKPKDAPGKRKSRKKLGAVLVDWMEHHTGWQDYDELLAAVIENEMTDADPRRALKITLGKGAGRGVFEEDADGRWRLVGDTDGGPAVPKKTVVLKRGGKRKSAPAKDIKPRQTAAKRWNQADDDEVERARKNLLGVSLSAR